MAADASGPKHFNKTLTRQTFESLVGDLVEQTVEPCQTALKDANLQPADIHKVILVGGQTRSPIVERTVERIFGKKPSAEINPDEVVAMGAAIQGAVINGDVKDIVLLDVLPLSLGLATRGGLFTKIIERNSTIPLRESRTFTTVVDNQSSVEIHVLQGEREIAQGNRSLGKFELVGIPPSPRGVPQIEVTFDIDANGILHITAQDKATGKEQRMQIMPSSGLSDAEIEKMVKDAELHQEEDTRRKSYIETRNQADTLVFAAEKTMREQGEHISSDLKSEIEGKIETVKKALESDDIDAIKSSADDLGQTLQKIGQEMYGAA
ncbi:MAG TPA: Hsp70 family protein, partial [Pyrinomonadaceae bacterium]|nr:Hsp70 family protein [Pyrinomonadaceae bacterium]